MTRTRRDVLAVGGTALLAGVAGCLGSGDGGSPSGETVDSLPTPTLGPADAPVTVDVFEDYACPHCMRYSTETFPKVRSTYVDAGVVRYRYYDFPIPVDETWSYRAASAARGVQDTQGMQAFFEYQAALYEHFGEYSMELVGQLASRVGADPQTIRDAAANGTYRPVLAADRRTGVDRGVKGTPAIFVNGSLLPAYDWDTVRTAIEAGRTA
ncbi:MAG: DsbA family protein [Halanaeroarchaeum sp.]